MTTVDLSLQTGKLVLVEDDDDVRHSLTLMLRARGYSVEVYRSGVELLSNRTLPEADCLLIDYKMPRLDGLELMTKLRTAGLTAPALMITGFFSNTLKSRAQAAGFTDIIEKPPPGNILLARIIELIVPNSQRV